MSVDPNADSEFDPQPTVDEFEMEQNSNSEFQMHEPTASDLLGKGNRSWAQLKAFDTMEEAEIRDFEKIGDHESLRTRLWDEFKRNPIMFIEIRNFEKIGDHE